MAVITGLGGSFGVNDGVSSAQQTFSNVTNVTVPFGEVTTIPYTTLGQSDRWILKVGGMWEPGKFTAEMLYSSTDYARVAALRGVSKTYKWVIPTDGGGVVNITWTGFLTKAEIEQKNDAITMIKVEGDLSGAPTVS